jgi:hypothetical protein
MIWGSFSEVRGLLIPPPKLLFTNEEQRRWKCFTVKIAYSLGDNFMKEISLIDKSSVSDPYPHGSATILIGLIQIRIQAGKNDPQK